jgi:hypothetical protein
LRALRNDRRFQRKLGQVEEPPGATPAEANLSRDAPDERKPLLPYGLGDIDDSRAEQLLEVAPSIAEDRLRVHLLALLAHGPNEDAISGLQDVLRHLEIALGVYLGRMNGLTLAVDCSQDDRRSLLPRR